MKKYITAFFITGGIFSAIVIYMLLTGPMMENQQSIKTYEKEMRHPPINSVPVEKSLNNNFLKQKNNPFNKADEQSVYEYYCQFCHGTNGSGNAPVGDSFFPKPADLRKINFQTMSDELIMYKILNGKGHEPVLKNIIPENYYGLIISRVRDFNKNN